MPTFVCSSKPARVTEILKAFTSFDQVPKDILEKAAARGTSVHALCAGIAKGNWIPDGFIEEELLGYVNSFRKWNKAQVKRFIIIEKRYTDTEEEYTGQLDFVVECHDNKLYLVDLKTSAQPQKTYRVQMAAYDSLLKQNDIVVEGAMLVYLSKDGDFPEIDLIDDMSEEYKVFCSALHCHKYFKLRKKNGKRTERVPTDSEHHGRADLHPEG